MPTIYDRISSALSAFQNPQASSVDDIGPPAAMSWTWNPFTGQFNEFQPMASLSEFGNNPYLYSAADILAAEAARIPLLLKRTRPDGSDELVTGTQADELLARPAPMPGNPRRTFLTKMQLRYVRNLHMALNGEAFWLMDDLRSAQAGGAPQRIFPLLPERVEVKISGGFPSEYVYHDGKNQISYPPEAIIHFKKMNPSNLYRGMSPMKPARYAVASYREGEELNYERMKSNGFPDVVLSSEQKIPEQERESLLERFIAKFGTQKKKQRIGFMPYGVKAEALSSTSKDMQFAENMQRGIEAILANWRVPPDVLGQVKNSTFANAEAALFQFMRFCVLPIIEIETDTMTSDYLTMFPESLGQFYTTDDFIPENMSDKRENNKALFSMGGLSPNEARQEFGYDASDDENADKLYVPSSIVPLEDSGKQPVPPALDPNADPAADPNNPDTPPEKIDPKDTAQRRKQAAGEQLPDWRDLLDDEEEVKKFESIINPAAVKGFTRGVELAKKPKSRLKPSEMLTPERRQALKDQSFAIAADVFDTSQKKIRDIIEEAIANGFGSDKVAATIRKTFKDTAPVRARATARTLLTGTINNGQYRTLVREGSKDKTWVTITDGRQRDSHGKANGQTVPIDGYFVLDNGTALFPGDDNLPSDESINCRCDIVGGGTTEAFQRQHFQQFLQLHGRLEDQLTAQLAAEFKRQGERAIKALSS